MQRKRIDFPVPVGLPSKRCQCGAEIVFVRHERTGRRMPISVKTIQRVDGELRGESHFADCPRQERFRLGAKAKGAR